MNKQEKIDALQKKFDDMIESKGYAYSAGYLSSLIQNILKDSDEEIVDRYHGMHVESD